MIALGSGVGRLGGTGVELPEEMGGEVVAPVAEVAILEVAQVGHARARSVLEHDVVQSGPRRRVVLAGHDRLVDDTIAARVLEADVGLPPERAVLVVARPDEHLRLVEAHVERHRVVALQVEVELEAAFGVLGRARHCRIGRTGHERRVVELEVGGADVDVAAAVGLGGVIVDGERRGRVGHVRVVDEPGHGRRLVDDVAALVALGEGADLVERRAVDARAAGVGEADVVEAELALEIVVDQVAELHDDLVGVELVRVDGEAAELPEVALRARASPQRRLALLVLLDKDVEGERHVAHEVVVELEAVRAGEVVRALDAAEVAALVARGARIQVPAVGAERVIEVDGAGVGALLAATAQPRDFAARLPDAHVLLEVAVVGRLGRLRSAWRCCGNERWCGRGRHRLDVAGHVRYALFVDEVDVVDGYVRAVVGAADGLDLHAKGARRAQRELRVVPLFALVAAALPLERARLGHVQVDGERARVATVHVVPELHARAEARRGEEQSALQDRVVARLGRLARLDEQIRAERVAQRVIVPNKQQQHKLFFFFIKSSKK